MTKLFDLTGRLALITGSSQGIGLSLASGLAQAGARIVLNGRMRHSEIRVRRSGMAVLSAMCSRAFLADLRQARAEGRMPSVADPTQAA